MSGGSLGSYPFVSGVGGVAFAGVAKPGPSLAAHEVRPAYDPSRPDGQRFAVEVAGDAHFQSAPDWILVPAAVYASSVYNACVSLFGPASSETHYDIVYHEAFENTLLGLRLLQADILFFDLNETWRLPRLDGKTVLGLGEAEPGSLDLASAIRVSSGLGQERFQSWVLTDQDEPIGVDLVGGELRFTGLPYYHFWVSDLERYRREVDRLAALARAEAEAGDVAAHNRIVRQINAMEPEVREVKGMTKRMRSLREAIRDYNPAVYDAAMLTMRYAAFFRYLKERQPEAWREFLRSLPSPRSVRDRKSVV